MNSKKRFLIVTLATLGLVLSACSKQETPPPTPPPAAGPGGPPGPGSFSGNLEDASPGTQLSQANYRPAFEAMRKNLIGMGTATVTAQTLIDYVVQPGYRDAIFTRQQGGTNPPQAPPNGQFQFEGYSRGYLEDLSLVFYSQYDGYVQFDLAFEYELYGKVLYTTDQMAIFVSRGYPRKLLKVMYATPNPPMNFYAIEEYGSYGGNSQIRLHVSQKSFSTQITGAR